MLRQTVLRWRQAQPAVHGHSIYAVYVNTQGW
jgi:hypothetical protein